MRSLLRARLKYIFAAALLLSASFTTFAQQDKVLIIIPGLTGSELVNSKTGEVVWFKAPRSKDDDLRLPISANVLKNNDNLIPGDILRSVKVGIFPRIDVYNGLIDSFTAKGGYHEELWNSPTSSGDKKGVYLFAYDWRKDNVSNARLLIRAIDDLRKKLNKPDLKADVIAHSMGGMIARYAAMYGDVDLPTGGRKPVPTWAGAKYFDRVVLMGTPNEGSPLALRALVEGFAIGGININLPFVQNLTIFDTFTIPSSFQLLPAPGTLKVVDEDLKPIDLDVYDPKTWRKYGWGAINDKRFAKEFSAAERRSANAYFAAVLTRAKRLQTALSAPTSGNGGVRFEIVGADCQPTLDTIMVYFDRKKREYKTLFKPSTITVEGSKVKAEDVKNLMMQPGDGVVTRRSLLAETRSRAANVESILRPETTKFICAEHNQLGASTEVEDYLIDMLATRP